VTEKVVEAPKQEALSGGEIADLAGAVGWQEGQIELQRGLEVILENGLEFLGVPLGTSLDPQTKQRSQA
jgi:hypothetical protein